MRWAKEKGAKSDKAELVKLPEGGGLSLVVSEDIAEGELVLSIPANLLFPSLVSKTSLSSAMLRNADNSTIGRVSALCIYLMGERLDPESFWAPWISSLPDTFRHALSYKDEEMEMFQASAFKELRQRKITNLRSEYESIIKPLVDAQDFAAPEVPKGVTAAQFGFDAFEWAYSVITTRAVFPGLLSDKERIGEVPVVLLGPLTDALKHGESTVSISFDGEGQEARFTAIAPIAKGDAVSVGCGLTSNLELLANRGSLVAANRNNFVLIKFQLDMDADIHASAKQAMMRQLNLTNPMTYIVRSGEMPQGLLSSLRIQSLSPTEFTSYHKALESPVSLDNEWRAYRLLISSCNAILGLYKTSVEEDEALLGAGGGLTARAQAAVSLRRQEKLIYDSVKAWAHDAWSSLLYAGASTSE